MRRSVAALLVFWLTAGVVAQEQLVPPEPTPAEIFGSPSLSPPLFSHFSAIPIEQFCDRLAAAEPLAGLPASGDPCSFESGKFFVSVRANGEGVGTARIKLNSSVATVAADLEELVAFSQAVFRTAGWPLPQSLRDAMAAGSRYRCQTGFLRYDFSRERGEVPRFNLIVRLDAAPPASSAFGSWLMPCSG